MKKIILSFFLVFLSVSLIYAADNKDNPATGDSTTNVDKPKKQKNSKFELKQNFEVDFAYYPGTYKGLGISGFAPVNYGTMTYTDLEAAYPSTVAHGRKDLGLKTSVELKAYYTLTLKFPVMRMNNALMEGNNIQIKYKLNLSPITVETGAYVRFTPLALLYFTLGTKVATGWNLSFMNLNGLNINDPNFYYTDTVGCFAATPGVLSISEFSAVFQFDLGAIVKGNWTHVIFFAKERVEYQYFSAAGPTDYWRYEHDNGENVNGFMWYQTFVIGYQMPTLPGCIDTVGFMIETEQHVTQKDVSTMASGGWGSDFLLVKFGPMINFKFNKVHNFTVLVEFKNARHFTDETMGNRYFQERKINTADPEYVQFYRIALLYSMDF